MDAVLPTPGGAKSNQGEIETLFVRTLINLSKLKTKGGG
jgi:hypothetical protein